MNTLTALFIAATTQYHLPPGLLSALCFVESGHRVDAIHHDDGGTDSLGICQIKLKTAQWLGFKGTAEQLLEPAQNIKYSAKYLSYQIKRYKGSLQKAVIAYNRGHARQQEICYGNKAVNGRKLSYCSKVFKRFIQRRQQLYVGQSEISFDSRTKN